MAPTISVDFQENQMNIKLLVSRLDAANARHFKDKVEESWTGGITTVHVHLEQLDFIDSSGVGALLSVYKKLASPANNVILYRVKPQVQSILELLRLHRIFEIQN